jgi:hypothetical protein
MEVSEQLETIKDQLESMEETIDTRLSELIAAIKEKK